ncbi:DUF7738 domain-containing protein [Tenacibaculum sp. M341]|uniref:DUF7738 domain-containing protein n=1 Tax=Tenacibaculum sp. M341 TaxID=2530339 RepID=UPI0010539085|nr:hypothetical protein [Tenacibaculum sp. M341]TCI90034.1 hypothetical protein EYW44_15320 [Tenacibaculum sp. M341]
MLKFLKKKKTKEINIVCKTNEVIINDIKINFPTTTEELIAVFEEPSRKIEGTNQYLIWDDLGISCTIKGDNEILSINVYQSNNISEYVAQKPFAGKLYLEEDEITFSDFSKIGLNTVAIHRLGSESENRFGFSVGINNEYVA